MRQVRARWEGRAGGGAAAVAGPAQTAAARSRSPRAAPAWCSARARGAAGDHSADGRDRAAGGHRVARWTRSADLFVVALLLLGTVALALAGLDTGTAFGGMGASREITIAALVEPTILVAVFALSVRVGSDESRPCARWPMDDRAPGDHAGEPLPRCWRSRAGIVIIAETGRLPVDNPATHLELTMVHEAMVLEYAGRDLALVEWASAMRLTVLLALLANLFLPWGIATDRRPPLASWSASSPSRSRSPCWRRCWPAAEVFMAKLRLFRVPELLAGSFLLALLAVTAAVLLACKGAVTEPPSRY